MTTFLQKKNFAQGELSADITAGATSVVLKAGQGALFPGTGSFRAVMWNKLSFDNPADDSQAEIVTAVFSAGETFAITRAAEGTSASAHLTNHGFALVATAGQETEQEDAINALEATAPTSGQKDALAGTVGTPSSINKYVTETDPAIGGEANTASNVGASGVGVFKQKTGIDLEFKKINAGSSKITITDDTGNDEVDIDVPDASTTQKGAVELATVAEVDPGTDAARAITPDALAGSKFGERAIQLVIIEFATDVAIGDGKFFFHIDSRLAGMNLVDVHAEVITAGTTGTLDIQIRNVTQAADMLTTKLTIDSGETGSDTAAVPAVIDAANDDVAENDVIAVDIDAVQTTAPKGLLVTLGFRLP